MTDKNAAIILAVENAKLPADVQASGLHKMDHLALLVRLQEAGTWLGPRGVLEGDERFRQIIPYVVVKQGSRIVTYVRGETGGEARLHGRISIGVGGHIDIPDIVDNAGANGSPTISLGLTLEGAAARELTEELHFDGAEHSFGPVWKALIVDNADPVGRVHVGVLGVINVSPGVKITAAEDCVSELAWMTVDELAAADDRLEGWTRIALDALRDA